MKQFSIISRADVKRMGAYRDYGYVIDALRDFLSGYFGKAYRLYEERTQDRLVWPLLSEDVVSYPSPVEHLATVYDQVESHCYRTGVDGFEIRPLENNGVFHYPQFGVVLARMILFEQHADRMFEFVFAPDDEALQRFLAFSAQRVKRQSRNVVEKFVDTRHGMSRFSETVTRAVSRADVVMDDALKTQIYDSIEAFFSTNNHFFKLYDIPHKRGILLYGRPGNGKTTIIKSIISSIDAPVAYWQITEHTDSDSIAEVFGAAERMAPMVLVIEDIDSMPDHARSTFLNILDGASSKEGIFLIGTTNYPERIDPALMHRAGRFDRAYEMKLPDVRLRQVYLQRRGLRGLATEQQVAEAARLSEGFSFAQLNELFVSIALRFHNEGVIDVREAVASLNGDLEKGRSMSWLEGDTAPRVGFLVQN